MQTPKKELIIGAVIVVLVAQSLIGGITTIMKYSQPVIADDNVASIFAWILTVMTVGYTVLGAVLILKAPRSVENLSKKYTIKATIPGYFLFALLPYTYGLALIELTRLSTWGYYLACASIPTVLLFLVLLLRRKDSNDAI